MNSRLHNAPETFTCEVCGGTYTPHEVEQHLVENNVQTFVCPCGETKFLFSVSQDRILFLESRGLENTTALQLIDELLEG